MGWLPLFHDMGLVGHVLQPVYVGGLSILMSPLVFLQRPIRWLKAISSWRATTSGGPSHSYALCLRSPSKLENLDLSSWNVAFHCGENRFGPTCSNGFPRALAPTGFREKSFFPCYGLAEATLFVTGVKCHDGLRVAIQKGSANHQLVGLGRPLENSVAIRDPSGFQVFH